jgi:hypothetical protein
LTRKIKATNKTVDEIQRGIDMDKSYVQTGIIYEWIEDKMQSGLKIRVQISLDRNIKKK